MPRGLFLALRAAFVAFFFLTSLYCLLAHNPFTYTQVIQAGLLPWLSGFARLHRWLFWAAMAGALATFKGDLAAKPSRSLALLCAVTMCAAGVVLTIHPVLPTLGSDKASLVFSQVALLFPLAVAVIDHIIACRAISWTWTSTREDGSVFSAGAACLLFAYVTYSVVFHLRAAPDLRLTHRDEEVALLLSLLLHASFVGAAFIVWCLARALATWVGGPRASMEYGVVAALAVTLFALLTRNIAFAAMSFRGAPATASAITWALVLIAAVSGMALRVEAPSEKPVESGLRLLMSPLSMPHASLALRGAWIAAILVLAVRLQIVASRMDWNGLMQKLCACFSWTMLFAAALAVFRPALRGAGRTIVLMGLASSATLAYGVWRTLGRPADRAQVLDQLALAEPSFGFLYDLAGSQGSRETMGELFDFMQRNSNLAYERRIEPLDVVFANNLGAAPGPKPHIFIIVVDSLRRDYLSSYNPLVTFTPSIDKFARSSDVFVNAFTHYGATGLSEPSIWVGGMMPHKQYIVPFAPMNALEKLLLAEHYVRMVSVDSILSQLLDQGTSLVPLDANTVTGDYDLCGSLDELRGKIGARPNQETRFFAYTQPQNIHVSRITREGASVPSGVHFPGFYDPYASRLARIDACFGRFIDYLQAEGLYDESIVVFAADHGDMLGEEGRWGHAYNLNPEVVRIPLVIHRPERLRVNLSVDISAVAFSTDIAPSIYRLLGYMPATLGAGFGQSLYGPRAPGREWHLLVSSYGPVYGVLEDDARHLYVADAINYTDSYFDVAAGSNAPRDAVTDDVRSRNMERIMTGVKELHETFHVADVTGPSTPAPSHSH